MKSNALDCTVLIFTYERPEYLRRCIRYWEDFDVHVIIADGSKESFEVVSDSILYLHRPGASITDRVNELIDHVNTKYAVFTPDDDFLGHEGLSKSLEFLHENEGYSSIQGQWARFWTLSPMNTVICAPHDYGYASNYNWNNDDFIQRLIDLNSDKLMHYCYSVVTADVLKTFTSLTVNMPSRLGITLFEPLMAYAIALNGKVGTLEYFFCARQLQVQNWGELTFFEDFIRENSKDYQTLIQNVAKECIRLHGVSMEEAVQIARQAGDTYSDALLVREKNKLVKNIQTGKIKKCLQRIRGSIKACLQILGILKKVTLDEKCFSDNSDALTLFKQDWKTIEKIIQEEKICDDRFKF